MARSHHRKKHRAHVKAYQHQHASPVMKSAKARVTTIFTVLGAATGFGIGLFASGTILWLLAGMAVGGVAGFLIGKKIDEQY